MLKGIIGDLSIGEMFSDAMEQSAAEEGKEGAKDADEKPGHQVSKEQMEKMQKQQQERVKKLADNLLHKLDLYVKGGDEGAAMAFEEQIKLEAEKLKTESYGLELLHSIGGVYSSKAKHFLGLKGGEMPSLFHNVKQKRHIMKELWSTVRSAMDMQAVAEMVQKAEEQGVDQAERLRLEEEATNRVCVTLDHAIVLHYTYGIIGIQGFMANIKVRSGSYVTPSVRYNSSG